MHALWHVFLKVSHSFLDVLNNLSRVRSIGLFQCYGCRRVTIQRRIYVINLTPEAHICYIFESNKLPIRS